MEENQKALEDLLAGFGAQKIDAETLQATAVTAMRQDQGDLLRSSQSAPEVVIESLQHVAKAIDGSLPT